MGMTVCFPVASLPVRLFLNAMTLDIAMGGSTNTVLHLLAVAHEAEADFSMDDIDMLSRKTPCLCKVAPNTQKYHIQDVNRAGGIIAIMSELAKGGLVDTNVKRVDGMTLADVIDKYGITSPNVCEEAVKKYKSAAAGKFNLVLGSQDAYYKELDTDRAGGCIRDLEHAYSKDGGLAVLKGNIAQDGCVVKTAGVDESIWNLQVLLKCSIHKTLLAMASLPGKWSAVMLWSLHTKVRKAVPVCKKCSIRLLISNRAIWARNVH